MNTVLIVTNFRAGSTAFTLLKAQEYNLPFKGELFSHERPHSLGEAKATWELNQLGIFGKEKRKEFASDEKFIEQLENGEPCCFKYMPYQLHQQDKNIDRLMNSVDKIYYLYRRDFMAQCKSWIAVRQQGDFGGTGFISGPQISKAQFEESQREKHLGLLGKTEEPVKHHIEINPEGLYATRLVKQLTNNYEYMAKLYKKYPGELVCMEDFFENRPEEKYNRIVTFERDPILPEGFDVEKLFMG
jgi:hypothetical protein